jgi:hypothetical protein
MRAPVRRLLPAILLVTTLAACGPLEAPSRAPASTSPPSPTAPVTSVGLAEPTPVPVPDSPAAVAETGPVPVQPGVTRTSWGNILDTVPAEWPVYPGAEPADAYDGPASGAWLARDPLDRVTSWYRGTLQAQGYTIADLSSPLEDGTRILDIVTDLPECRIQVAFRPAGSSTMVTVLYGAGCAGGDS